MGAALVGLQQARMLRGAFREIEAHVVELAEVSTRLSDPVIGNWGTLMAAAATLHRGHLVDARRQLSDVANSIGRAPSIAPGSDAPSFPYGPLLFSNLAVAEWLVGRPDAALASALESVALAESLGDPFTLSLGLAAAATVHAWRRDPADALAFARRGMQVSSDAGSGLGFTRAAAVFYLASVQLDEMPAANALEELDNVLSVNAASRAGKTGSALAVIELATRAGQVERGLAEVVGTLAYAEKYDERVLEPELHRVRGELLIKTDPVGAKRSFTRAVELAREQGSRALELRAALSLHRTASRSDKPASLEDVRRIREAFSEGATTGDLIEATRLLERATV